MEIVGLGCMFKQEVEAFVIGEIFVFVVAGKLLTYWSPLSV